MQPYCVVLMSAPDAKSAERIAEELVDRKLAACVNRVGGVVSHYRWEGELETSKEVLLIAKTRSSLVGDLAACVKTLHPYDVPEIISLPISEGYGPYLNWIGASTLFTKPNQQAKTEPGA